MKKNVYKYLQQSYKIMNQNITFIPRNELCSMMPNLPAFETLIESNSSYVMYDIKMKEACDDVNSFWWNSIYRAASKFLNVEEHVDECNVMKFMIDNYGVNSVSSLLEQIRHYNSLESSDVAPFIECKKYNGFHDSHFKYIDDKFCNDFTTSIVKNLKAFQEYENNRIVLIFKKTRQTTDHLQEFFKHFYMDATSALVEDIKCFDDMNCELTNMVRQFLPLDINLDQVQANRIDEDSFNFLAKYEKESFGLFKRVLEFVQANKLVGEFDDDSAIECSSEIDETDTEDYSLESSDTSMDD